MKLAFLILSSLLFLAAPVAAQDTCLLEAEGAPPLIGLRLRMTPDAARGAIGRGLKIKVKNTGERVFFQNFIQRPAPAALRGVRALYLRFLDGRLYQIEVFYDAPGERGASGNPLNDWAARAGLPESSRQTDKSGIAKVKCADFSVAADNILNPHLELTDDAARARALALRRKK